MESIDLEFDHIPVHTVHKDAKTTIWNVFESAIAKYHHEQLKKDEEPKQYSAVHGTVVLHGKQDDDHGEESS